MSHPRDHKIAKLLKNCICEFFHNQASYFKVVVDNVIMIDRKNAQIFYRLDHDTIESESIISDAHERIMAELPKARKFIADQLNLKAIPNLSFSILLQDE